MLTLKVRRGRDITYLTRDEAGELDGLRAGPALRWLRGDGDLSRSSDVEALLTSTPRSRVVGYDVILAAPRPISILLALDEASAPGVVRAHQRSVDAAMEYLEDRALVVRDRRGGEDRDRPGRWAQMVAFTHGINRQGEPHLHDHVLVGARPRGESRVVDSRSLFAHLLTADALYRSSLRAGVARETGYQPWRSFEGREHVEGLDEGYRVLWGGHHADRGEKLHWGREEARRRWRADLARFEPHVLVPAPARHRDSIDEHAFAAAFEGRLSVGRRHLVRAWADAAVFGAEAREVDRCVDLLHPNRARSRGVREDVVSVTEARATALVRERGPRPLTTREMELWCQRSVVRSRDGVERSR